MRHLLGLDVDDVALRAGVAKRVSACLPSFFAIAVVESTASATEYFRRLHIPHTIHNHERQFRSWLSGLNRLIHPAAAVGSHLLEEGLHGSGLWLLNALDVAEVAFGGFNGAERGSYVCDSGRNQRLMGLFPRVEIAIHAGYLCLPALVDPDAVFCLSINKHLLNYRVEIERRDALELDDWAHLRGLRFGFGGAAVVTAGKVRPDPAPCVPAEHLPSEFAAGLALDPHRFGRVHVPASSQALIEVLLTDPDLLGQFDSACWCDVHAAQSSVSLATVKRFALV